MREVRHYEVRPGRPEGGRDLLSGGLLWVAGAVMAASLAGAGYVAYESLKAFAFAHNHGDDDRATIAAALPEAGWIAMAIVALVAALRGRSSARARFGVVMFFGLSLGAQLMYAEQSPEGFVVAVIPPLVLAWMLESFVVEVRRWVSARRGLDLDESPILTGVLRAAVRVPWLFGRAVFWLLRLRMDRAGTWGGFRTWVLDEAPIAPGRTAASLRADQALQLADGAEQSAEKTRRAADQQIAEERRAAAEHAEKLQREAAAQVESVRAAAAGQMQTLAEQITAERQEAARQLQDQAARHETEREQHRVTAARTLQQTQSDARAAAAQHAEDARALHREVAELRDQVADLSGKAPKRARLIAAYEALGRRGDVRYGDRAAVGEVARELAPAAGLESDGTARAYLSDYLKTTEGPQGGRGEILPSEMSQQRVMIGGNNGVNGS